MNKTTTNLSLMLLSSTALGSDSNLEDRQMQLGDKNTLVRIQAKSCAVAFRTNEGADVICEFLSQYEAATT